MERQVQNDLSHSERNMMQTWTIFPKRQCKNGYEEEATSTTEKVIKKSKVMEFGNPEMHS